jgi:hypothetical protein
MTLSSTILMQSRWIREMEKRNEYITLIVVQIFFFHKDFWKGGAISYLRFLVSRATSNANPQLLVPCDNTRPADNSGYRI